LITFFFKAIKVCSESKCGDNGLVVHLPCIPPRTSLWTTI
jgi:hypothetical protein